MDLRTLRRVKDILLGASMLCVCAAYGNAEQFDPTAPPLHTDGAVIRDSRGVPVRLVSVNWFGFDEGEYVVGGLDRAHLHEIAQLIRKMGFNSVRLPWANQIVEENPRVPDYALNANPQLRGKRSLEIMDAVIAELAAEHIMVILDNHVSRSDWCCSDKDGNGLWYSREYPETHWIEDWKTLATRYKAQPYVVGADLRNETRSGARWGGNDPAVDWHAAAERGGDAVLSVNANLLIVVEGPDYALQLQDFGKLPVHLSVPNRLVYSPHNYGFSQGVPQTYEELKAHLDERWGYLLSGDRPTPIWVGEMGVCQNLADCRQLGSWFPYFVRYMKETGVSWSYWTLNGTQSSGAGRLFGKTEDYGLLGVDYREIAAPDVLKELVAAGLRPQP